MGWASVAGGGNKYRGIGIVAKADGSVYSMGTYLDTLIFQAGSREFLIPGSEQSNNTYIEKFSPEGYLIWDSGFSGFGLIQFRFIEFYLQCIAGKMRIAAESLF